MRSVGTAMVAQVTRCDAVVGRDHSGQSYLRVWIRANLTIRTCTNTTEATRFTIG